MSRTCAADGCTNIPSDRARFCSPVCRVRAHRGKGQRSQRIALCPSCGTRFERQARGRPAVYCGAACRMAGARLRVEHSPGAVVEFIEYTAYTPGASADAERFYNAYVEWCNVQRIEPLEPNSMLPVHEELGFEIYNENERQRVRREEKS